MDLLKPLWSLWPLLRRPTVTSSYSVPIGRGKAVRIRLRVDPAFADAAYRSAPAGKGQVAAQNAVAAELTRAGFDVRLTTQDPQDTYAWIALAHSPARAAEALSPAVRITSVEVVDEFPAVETVAGDHALDAGLSTSALEAIRFTLERDHDPKRIAGMANAFDVDYPVAASVLRNKARLEGYARTRNLKVGHYRDGMRLDSRIGAVLSATGATERAALNALEASVGGLGNAARQAWSDYGLVLACLPLVTDLQDRGQDAVIIGAAQAESLTATMDPKVRAIGYGETVSLLAAEPELLTKMGELVTLLAAREVEIPKTVLLLAVASVRPLGSGLSTVDPELARAVMPSGPPPVSRSALQLAHSLERPEGSLVASPRTLSRDVKKLRAAAEAGDVEARKAQAEVGRARRFLDRQQWIDHVARTMRAEAREE